MNIVYIVRSDWSDAIYGVFSNEKEAKDYSLYMSGINYGCWYYEAHVVDEMVGRYL